ncbi:MAG: hypothetical protein HeimC3_35550 [Candidatus Heimdallarchaeota archaeon LC_3]|nr:MAG: hypothetical protein HeimC3_35550 [Candidatus Heimdallarchaeota archaeon LC_3]
MVLCCTIDDYFKKSFNLVSMDKKPLEDFKNKLITWNKGHPGYKSIKERILEENQFILPTPLNKLNWVIYENDAKYLYNPYLLILFNKILDLKLSSESIFGKEMLEYLEKEYSITTNAEARFSPYLGSLYDKYNLIDQQDILTYRVHWVDTVHEYSGLLFCTQPITHEVAQLLANYYQNYLEPLRSNKLGEGEFMRNFNEKQIIYGYWEDEIKTLKNDDFCKKQKELRDKIFS